MTTPSREILRTLELLELLDAVRRWFQPSTDYRAGKLSLLAYCRLRAEAEEDMRRLLYPPERDDTHPRVPVPWWRTPNPPDDAATQCAPTPRLLDDDFGVSI